MKLASLTGGTRTVQVPVPATEEGSQDETVTVTYRPGALTLETVERIGSLSSSGSEASAIVEVFASVLESWDIETEDGQYLGVDPAAIKKVPVRFLFEIFSIITEDARPDPQIGEASEGSSPQTEEQGSFHPGTG